MQIVRSIEELKRSVGVKRGFVPTMGAFHQGHISLMNVAKQECDEVVVSLFVNPLQFGPNEDLSRYPRNEEQDASMAEAAGVDILFIPSEDIFVKNQRASIKVLGVSEAFEGATRPGHFEGVATIVGKLFHVVLPQVAYFGLKDRQQCAVISRMVADLNFPVQLSFQATVREFDGLAMSSRNVYLSADDRKRAPLIYSTLKSAEQQLISGANVTEVLDSSVKSLTENGFELDYLELVDPETFEKVDALERNSVIIIAAKLGKTRLIDNLDVSICG